MLPEPRLACRFYRTDSGNEPVRDWLKGLPAEVRKAIGEDRGRGDGPAERVSEEDGEDAEGPRRARPATVGGIVVKRKNIGSTLDSLFRETGELDQMNERLSKRIFVEQLRKAMRKRRISLSEVARRMHTSRPSVYRLLDPAFSGVTLESLVRASAAVGMTFEPRLVERRSARSRVKRGVGPRKAA
jgi:predicted XRE-type DNA-binding protein